MSVGWDVILLDAGLVERDQIQAALAAVGSPDQVAAWLAERGVLTEPVMYDALAARLGLEHLRQLSPEGIDGELVAKVPVDFCKRAKVLPLRKEGGAVVVATANPLDHAPLDDLRALLQEEVRPVVAAPGLLARAIDGYYEREQDLTKRVLEDMPDEVEGSVEAVEAAEDLLDVDQRSPVVKLVRSILFDAIKTRASDVHIEPFEKEITVRYRIDGILYETASPPKRLQPLIISRIKILAGMDIAESRLPQDGRIPITVGDRKLDIRVSTLPTAYGERVVMRILDKSGTVLDLPELGFQTDHEAAFRRMIRHPHGIILVTGPTGSGKSTTLYAALRQLASKEINVITVEDPIENEIAGVGQVQVKPGIGLTFAEGLRSILRQDPDIVMIGEIRDRETAEIAVQASLTGHLVFSTLHTNDAAGGFTRLVEMGVEPYLIASSVLGVLAQRLVRQVCPGCAVDEPITQAVVDAYGLPGNTVRRGAGCEDCRGSGYAGRIGIFELLEVDDVIHDLINERAPSAQIKKAAVAAGMRTLRQDGALKVGQGRTTLDEVARTTASGAALVDEDAGAVG